MGQPAYLMTYPERDLDVLESFSAVLGFQFPQKSEST
jgi:hypothetical protein